MDKRKEEIVEIALKRFCHYGFSKTTMNEIAEDLGITKANLYYYYSDKTALINDVIGVVSNEILNKQREIVANYKRDFLGTLFEILELRSDFLRKYYVLHINENLEWIRGVEITTTFKLMNEKENRFFTDFFSQAHKNGDLKINDLDISEICATYLEIIKGIGLIHSAHDVITGIPSASNVDFILNSQKRATKLIFESRINKNYIN